MQKGFYKTVLALAMRAGIMFCLPVFLVAAWLQDASATSGICAVVKIEIRQELTLERQAFDANMRINNGLSHLPLENVNIEVTFADEDGNAVLATNDPDHETASFFIRGDSEGISVNSDGSWDIDPVAPASSSDLHWLIIPAPGSADGYKDGKMYYVGATLSYTLGGEKHTTTVTPDYIFVKPLPRIVLDYFLTEEVYGNDAWTQEIEPPEPFTLGVRVKNTGENTAYNLQIDSAQPEIVENEQGLLIDFVIEGSRVNGEPARNSLLVDFGDIEPGSAAIGRWIMTCTLSGRFTGFEATVSHADELGGQLTSLLRQEDIHTHLLVKDVRVDLPGRDAIHDFLARDGGGLKVFESHGEDTGVADQSDDSGLRQIARSGSRFTYEATTPDNPGFIYFKLPDPHDGRKVLAGVTRSDGKAIRPANAWLSKERKDNPRNGWNYYVNVFDAGTTGVYSLVFDDPPEEEQGPVLAFIPDKTLAEGEYLSFLVEADVPEAKPLDLTVSGLPAMADFEDRGDGHGVFAWTPAPGQAGTYRLAFTASDGQLEDRRAMTITVHPYWDTDGDGMDDAWELAHFGTLDRDGTGDFDGDGISDLDEYLLGTNPTVPHYAPTVPVIEFPADKDVVDSLRPTLTVQNSRNSGRNIADGEVNNDEIFYEFELYADTAFREPVETAREVAAGGERTSWQAEGFLSDNRWYYWRVRASDGAARSLWAYGRFFTDTQNNTGDDPNHPDLSDPGYPDSPPVDPSSRPALKNPGKDAWVGMLSPRLSVHPIINPDDDRIIYTFDICADEHCETRLYRHETTSPAFVVPFGLDNNTRHFWRVMAADQYGDTGGWTETALFFVRQVRALPEISGTPPSVAVAGQPFRFEPGASGADPEDTLIFSIENRPEWAAFDPFTGVLSGTPAPEHTDSFFEDIVISVSDGVGAFASLPPFRLAILDAAFDPPIAVDDTYTIRRDMPLEVSAPGVLTNDLPGDGEDELSARMVEGPIAGTIAFNEDGSFIYIPSEGYTGEDAFTYVAFDGRIDSAPATVNILVVPEQTGPEISTIDDALIPENTAAGNLSFTVGDPEAPAEDLVIQVTSDNPALFPEENLIVGGAGHERTLTIIPEQNSHGFAVITLTVTDDSGESASTEFTVTVAPRDNPPFMRYFVLNPDLIRYPIRITSLSEDNHIAAGNAFLHLDSYESGQIDPGSLQQGGAITGTGAFTTSGDAPGSNMPVPEVFAGREFVVAHIRGSHTYYIASPYGDASVRIDTKDRVDMISIDQGGVAAFDAGGRNSVSSIITSDLPVLVSHGGVWSVGCSEFAMDAYPVPPATHEVWGGRVDDTYIGAMEDDTTVTVTRATGAVEVHLLHAGSLIRLSREYGFLMDALLNPDKAVAISADKPIMAVQSDGMRGDSATVLTGADHHGKRFAMPVEAKKVTAVCRHEGAVISLAPGSGPLIEKQCFADSAFPASVTFDARNVGSIPAGSHIESTHPVHVILETADGFATERNLLGVK